MHVKEGLSAGSALLATMLVVGTAPVVAVAGTGPYKVKELGVVSGPSPFPSVLDELTIPGHELEPAGYNDVGECQGLSALRGHDFAATFTMAAPQAENWPTDIFFARIGTG